MGNNPQKPPRCENCWNILRPGEGKCWHCGHKVISEEKEVPSQTAGVDYQVPTENTVPEHLNKYTDSFETYLTKFSYKSLAFGFGTLFVGLPFLGFYLIDASPYWAIPVSFIFFLFVSREVSKEMVEDIKNDANYNVRVISEHLHEANNAKIQSKKDEALWKKLLLERASGFPTLSEAISYYEKLRDEDLSGYLTNKPHPAIASAEIVREESKKRREAEYSARVTKAIIEYYENIAPFLLDFKDQVIDKEEDSLRDYSEEESTDPVTNYLTKEEFRKLPSYKRNQIALDRFWKRPKSKWLIGRLYERYVGYLYEKDGYNVDYVGVFKGYEDLGRDLICKKGGEIVVIQCKNWSQFKTIFEKHIFQFFGTVFQYRDEFPKEKVLAKFYTSTKVSSLARRFAKELGIELVEDFKLDIDYPCIKCNISQVGGEKIYHLPFDQQYDNTKIETKKGEFYCTSTKEAEEKGFRRAFRWKGQQVNAV